MRGNLTTTCSTATGNVGQRWWPDNVGPRRTTWSAMRKTELSKLWYHVQTQAQEGKRMPRNQAHKNYVENLTNHSWLQKTKENKIKYPRVITTLGYQVGMCPTWIQTWPGTPLNNLLHQHIPRKEIPYVQSATYTNELQYHRIRLRHDPISMHKNALTVEILLRLKHLTGRILTWKSWKLHLIQFWNCSSVVSVAWFIF